jgi:hypothetical protein
MPYERTHSRAPVYTLSHNRFHTLTRSLTQPLSHLSASTHTCGVRSFVYNTHKHKHTLMDTQTSIHTQEDLAKQHEEIMAENEALTMECDELRGIAEAAKAALEAADENEELKRELARYKKICESREKELLAIKGVSADAESF